MWSYRDRVFCPFWEECKVGEGCDRALTDEVRRGAERVSIPIARYKDRPECFQEKQEE